ncbi:pol [Symbiodinium sp. CCMP2456]|nr:pol [Symbiodinium sp. CCMP2456]
MAGMSKRQIDLASKTSVPEDQGDLSAQKAPRKEAADGGCGITAGELQAMMAQQTAQLMHAQESALSKAVTRFEGIVEERIGRTDCKVAEMEKKMGELEQKVLHLLEGGPVQQDNRGGTDDQARRARTLIFGGWNRDTRRAELLAELKSALESLGVQNMMDTAPFTTGVRRSMALASFAERRGESYATMRGRMQQVVRAFAESEVMGKQGKNLWCNWSKSKLERLHSSHASWVKRSVAEVNPDKLADLEVEWNQGNVWTAVHLAASSALPPPPGGDPAEILVRDDYETKAWDMAKKCTKPRPGTGYRDPEEVKSAFKQAKLMKTRETWKRALALRKQARKVWEADRLKRASEGDWQALKSCRPKRHAGWDDAFASAQQGDPHRAVHEHLAGVYQGNQPVSQDYRYTGEVRAFTLEEMRDALSMLKSQKAVGSDLTSRELLVGVMGVPGGEEHMLEWFNRTLVSQAVDLNKACDCIDRSVLLARLSDRLGPCAELGCWAALMTDITGTLQTPWGLSQLQMPSGIKQGATESPSMFSFIAEIALEETRIANSWGSREKLFEGMEDEECLYMDDGCLWNKGVQGMERKLAEYAKQLRMYGLTINISKCQMYCGPRCKGARSICVEGQSSQCSSHLEVMGLQFHVGVTAMEMVTALATKARGRFWEIQHVLRSKGGLSRRISTMQRTAGQAAMWCLGALAPDSGAMGYLNSVQLQLIVWMMRISRGPGEDWGSFRRRAWRVARAALFRSREERWSTLWLRNYWRYSGHRARGVHRDHPALSSVFDSFRTKKWWDHEKANPWGIKHVHHYARLMMTEAKMNDAVEGEWRRVAQDRVAWRNAEQRWITREDLPWASGRQPTIENGN